jgi:hypothetical protein
LILVDPTSGAMILHYAEIPRTRLGILQFYGLAQSSIKDPEYALMRIFSNASKSPPAIQQCCFRLPGNHLRRSFRVIFERPL